MNREIIKEYYSWNDYQKDIASLADAVRHIKGRTFHNVYGIPRGGLVVAVSLSHALNIPLILSREDITPETLIADDIADTGATLENLCRQLGYRPLIATLYYSSKSSILPDIYIRVKNKWVVFPWETDTSSRYDGTAR